MARPRQHSVIEVYMIRLAARTGRCGAPRSRATEVSGRSTGGVATLGCGAVAHSPLNATPSRPSALSSTAGSGRARGLCERTLMSLPMRASTRPPVSGGSASLGSPVSGSFSGGSTSAGSRSPVSASAGGGNSLPGSFCSVMTGAAAAAAVSSGAAAGTSAEDRPSAPSRWGGSTNSAIDFLPVRTDGRSRDGPNLTSCLCMLQMHRNTPDLSAYYSVIAAGGFPAPAR
jgi:hypothetical protein